MEQKLYPVKEVIDLIQQGKILVVAGSESVLDQLPQGNWIGGTTPYFMNKEGGCTCFDKIFVQDLSSYVVDFKIKTYDTTTISDITKDYFDNGFSYILFPSGSEIVHQYALNPVDDFMNPLFGWVTGMSVDSTTEKPFVYDGTTRLKFQNQAVVLHAALPKNQVARVEIFNNQQKGEGDIITFKEKTFATDTCYINGVETNLVNYLLKHNEYRRLPLIANYSGATICVGMLDDITEHTEKINFYSPVQPDVEYKIAKPDASADDFIANIPDETNKNVIASCNCVTNFIVLEMEGKKTKNITCPFVFGEIAYVLLNETLVYLIIDQL